MSRACRAASLGPTRRASMWRVHPSSPTRRARRSSATLDPSLPLKQLERQWWQPRQSSTRAGGAPWNAPARVNQHKRGEVCALLVLRFRCLTSIWIAVNRSAGAATGEEEGASAAHLEPEAAPEDTGGRAAQPAAADERAAARARRGHHGRRHAGNVGRGRLAAGRLRQCTWSLSTECMHVLEP